MGRGDAGLLCIRKSRPNAVEIGRGCCIKLVGLRLWCRVVGSWGGGTATWLGHVDSTGGGKAGGDRGDGGVQPPVLWTRTGTRDADTLAVLWEGESGDGNRVGGGRRGGSTASCELRLSEPGGGSTASCGLGLSEPGGGSTASCGLGLSEPGDAWETQGLPGRRGGGAIRG